MEMAFKHINCLVYKKAYTWELEKKTPCINNLFLKIQDEQKD